MSMTPLLRCHDLTHTRRFYVEVLSFAAVDSADCTLTVEKQGGKLIFTQQDLWRSPPTCSGTFYFTLTNAAAYYAAVKDGAPIAWPLQQIPYGSIEFGLRGLQRLSPCVPAAGLN